MSKQRVRGTLASPVVIDGTTVIPSGATLSGHVTHVDDSDKVKGRAELSFRFTRLTTGSVTYDIDTKPLSYVAESTKKDDAVKIGVGAAAGAVIGAITGGKKGAAIGTRRRRGRRHRRRAGHRRQRNSACRRTQAQSLAYKPANHPHQITHQLRREPSLAPAACLFVTGTDT